MNSLRQQANKFKVKVQKINKYVDILCNIQEKTIKEFRFKDRLAERGDLPYSLICTFSDCQAWHSGCSSKKAQFSLPAFYKLFSV